ncbi:hypothetical protein Tco_0693950 [Tanacetum coccineum]
MSLYPQTPFLSTAHTKIDVFKRKFTLRIGEEKLVFKSIKPATSIIRRVYMLKEGMNLDSKTKLIREAVNESFDPHYGNYIELNDFDMPLELRMDQDDEFEPTPDFDKGFSIIDDVDITGGVVLGMPFCKKFVSCKKIMERFAYGDECERMDDHE